MTEADALAFIIKQNLGFEYAEGSYVVRNIYSIGLIPPRRCAGQGTSLAEALKNYMGTLVDERGDRKPPLTEYVKEPTADPDVVAAVAADAKMPKPVEEPIEDDLIDVKPKEG